MKANQRQGCRRQNGAPVTYLTSYFLADETSGENQVFLA